MNLFQKVNRYCREAYTMGHFPSLFKILSTKEKVYAYYGFLGDKNFGDELVFIAAKKLFHPHILIPIKRRMPFELKILMALHSNKVAGIVIGGGTLIGPSFYESDFFQKISKSGKPVYVHGTGVHKDKGFNSSWSGILNNKSFGGVRGPLSVENLKNGLQVKLQIIGDAAFAMPIKNASAKNNSKNILVNIGTHASFENIDESRAIFKKFIKTKIEENYQLLFLPFHSVDVKLANDLKKEIPQLSVLPVPDDYDACAAYFNQATFAIGERLHFTVMAIMCNCPFLSINYAKKHDDLLASLEVPQLGKPSKQITFDALLTAFDERDKIDWDFINKKIDYYNALQNNERNDYLQNATANTK